MTSPLAKKSLLSGSVFLALAVLIGAFGAHGLKAIVTPEKLVTFETGVRYHFYHAYALIVCGLIQDRFSLKLSAPVMAFTVGIILFSFNCYFYTLTGLKAFALIVPVGGLLFILGWVLLSVALFRLPTASGSQSRTGL